MKIYFYVITVLCVLSTARNPLCSQGNNDCLGCHEDPGLVSETSNKNVSVKPDALSSSIHKNLNCIECHKDVDPEEFFHSYGERKLGKVKCSGCHETTSLDFERGVHGQALRLNEEYAPDCVECHGAHDIRSQWDAASKTYKMNIPYLCGSCHKEGSPVARIYKINEHNIIENYSQGIHGKGMYKSGLLVTATCNNCHNSHLILPHESPNSSVNPKQIAKTCMKCHIKIEKTHKKVIRSELWESRPGLVPSCSSCHPPHKVEYQQIENLIPNKECLLCHGQERNIAKADGNNSDFSILGFSGSVHRNILCVKCHTSVNRNADRLCKDVDKVDCSNCHIEISNTYFSSGHGKAYLKKSTDAPYCTNCHGTHNIKSRFDDTAPIYRGNIPRLCGSCHKPDGNANKIAALKEVNAYNDYSKSIHGKGLSEKGLLVSAVCTDCHTTHHELKDNDSLSSVFPSNIPGTCANCHKSIYEDYIASDHSILNSTPDKRYPSCTSCHSAHTISEIDQNKFMTEITLQCGSCHEELASTYKDTFHGKAYLLGDLNAARCSDCHGAHKILKVEDPNSMVGYKNIVNTCKKCHSNATLEFTGYLTHATHNDNPILFWSFWLMTSLLVLVFGFFGIHTLAWIPRSLMQRKTNKHIMPTGKTKYLRRFNATQRLTHILVILSFLILSLTGMTLKFAHMEWASWIASYLGGVKNAGTLHRFAAIVTFFYFAFHLFSLYQMRHKQGIPWLIFIFGSGSLMFNKQDFKDLWASLKWFAGKGKRPEYGRWTYWEKFDYMAVFWGVAVIGLSGLVLWFPEFFTRFIPGWAINVAQIIHSDEALLAVGFIFTIHFFNTHLRPESFPLDTVIFTGYVPLDVYKEDRPREYEELVESGKLESVVEEKEISATRIKTIKFFGFLFLAMGVCMILLIIYSLIKGIY
ncbi:MAG: hypothetical protein GXO88_05400 [Chlorobi bacterium]|nr:hypothetical protein [Chlorobiota bacterium]